MTGPGSELIIEAMYYYRVRAIYKAYDNLNSSDPTRPDVKKSLFKACNDYKALVKGQKYKALHESDKRYKNHLEDVLRFKDM